MPDKTGILRALYRLLRITSMYLPRLFLPSHRLRALIFATLSTLFGLAHSAHAADLTAYTEECPPYNYEENGVVKGISTDILRTACATAAISCDIQIVPWARAYWAAQKTANTLVFTTARKPIREHEFLWVGPILPRTTWVFGKPGSEKLVRKLKDLGNLRVGIVRGEASQQDLLAAGVPERAFRLESANDKVLKLVNEGLVDVMVDTEVGMAWNLRDAGLPPGSMTRLLKLSEEGAYYYALNPQTDPALVSKLQKALDKLRQDGKMKTIIGDYLGH